MVVEPAATCRNTAFSVIMSAMFETNFGNLDWAIVAIYLLAAVVIGVLVNRYIHSVSDYMVGGRATGAALNVATYIGTGLGLVTLMYASIDAFHNGFAYVILALIGAAVGIFLGSTGFVIGRLRDLKLTTIPEYFERRFDRRTRITAGVICASAGILNMGLFPKMGATFITYATGLGTVDGDQIVTINIITSILIVLVLVYTIAGGMVSVIVTDYLQFIVLSIGLGLAVVFCLTAPDLGWTTMVETLAENRGAAAFNPVAEKSYGWIWVGFNVVVFFAATICWAPEASRVLTAKDRRTACRTFLFAGPGQFIRLAIPAFLAVAAFTYFGTRPELAAHFFPDGMSEKAAHADQAMALLLGKIVPSGILGVLVAGLMAAFMSTHDSYLLCWSSVITRDIVAPLRSRPMSDRQQIGLTRYVILGIGLFLLLWGLWYPLPESVWTYMAVTGSIYLSGSIVAIIGGMYWPRASSTGAFAALLCGLLALVGLLPNMAAFKDNWPDALTAPVIGLSTFACCAVVFVIVSLLYPDPPGQVSRED
jgi:SSS family solute:Na+ symporter